MRSALANVSLAYATSTSWGGDVRPALTDGAVRLAPTTGRSDSSSASPASRRSAGASTPTRASAPESTSILAASSPRHTRMSASCDSTSSDTACASSRCADAAASPNSRNSDSLGSSSLSSAEATDAMEPESDRRCDSRPRSLSFRAERTMCICDAASLSMNESAGEAWGVGRFSARENIV